MSADEDEPMTDEQYGLWFDLIDAYDNEDDDHGPSDSTDPTDRDEYEPGGSRFD